MYQFPDMPVPGLRATDSPANGAGPPVLPPGGTSGVIRGLEATLLAMLANYNPSDVGICKIDPTISLALPVNDWGSYAWSEVFLSTWAASVSGEQLIYTVPQDERCELVTWSTRRQSGDNTIYRMRFRQPAGYWGGGLAGDTELIQTASGAVAMYWPDIAGKQTPASDVHVVYTHGHLRLEPGATLYLLADAAGVAETVWHNQIIMHRTKIVRAEVPYP